MRVFHEVTKWLFFLCLPLLLISASTGGAANSLALYRYGFDKFGVGHTTGLSEAELEEAAQGSSITSTPATSTST
jgi:hypothetical protein